MSVEQKPTPEGHLIDGVGPYSVGHEFTTGSIVAVVKTLDGEIIELPTSAYSVSPEIIGTASEGDVTLTSDTATTYASAELFLVRKSQLEQVWQAVYSPREDGLVAQLDRLTMGLQEIFEGVSASVRLHPVEGELQPLVAAPADRLNRAIIFGPDGTTVIPGPTADQIELAQGYAERAEAAAGRVDLGDLDQAVFDAQAALGLTEDARQAADLAAGNAASALIAAGLAEDGAVAARAAAELAAANAQSSARTTATWASLLALTGTADGEGAEVLDSDTGTHLAASETGYDGSSVNNAGRYTWNAAWSRWVRIGQTGLAGKQGIADTQVFGRPVAPVVGTPVQANPYILNEPAAFSGRVEAFTLQGLAAGRVFFFTWTKVGDEHTIKRIAGATVTTGLQTVSLESVVRVDVGDYTGFYTRDGCFGFTVETGDNNGYFTVSGFQPRFTDDTPTTTNRLQISATLIADLAQDERVLANAKPPVQNYGQASRTTGTGLTTNATPIFAVPVQADSIAWRTGVYGLSAGTIEWRVSDIVGSNFVVVAREAVPFQAGDNIIEMSGNLRAYKGQHLGLHVTDGQIAYVTADVGPEAIYKNGTGDVDTVPVAGTYYDGFELQVSIELVPVTDVEAEGIKAARRVRPTPNAWVLVWVAPAQSNGVGYATGHPSEIVAAGQGLRWDRASGQFVHLADPMNGSPSAAGSMFPALANAILRQTNGTVGLIVVNSAYGGTSITTNWGDGQTRWLEARQDIRDAIAQIETDQLPIIGVVTIAEIGETDADNGMSAATYTTAWNDVKGRIDAELGADVPVVMMQTGTRADGEPAGWPVIRDAQRDIALADPAVSLAYTGARFFADRDLMQDNYHYTMAAQEEVGRAIASAVLSKATSFGAGNAV